MMRRVRLCGFKPLDMTRKMPLCLGFRGVDTNGDGNGSDCDKCESDDHQKCSTNENFKKSEKGNILNVLRRKWRRTKRFKNRKKSESLINMCHSYSDCETVHSTKHRLKPHKSKSSISPSSNQLLKCPSCSEFDFTVNDSAQGDILDENKDSDDTCFPSIRRKSSKKTFDKIVKLKTRASRSLSDLSYGADVSSRSSKTDSENDICQISCPSKTETTTTSFSNRLCVDSNENVNTMNEDILNSGQKFGNLTQELYKLSKYGWYWGPINRSEAESKLVDQPDGAFLVRDSSDDRYILSLSFRSYGKTLHTRIEHSSGFFSFYAQPEPDGGLTSIVELIKQSMCYSQSGVFCYSRSRSPGSLSYPVRLTKPISRFTHVRSLQYLCRFVIRQYIRFDHIQDLPLPPRIKGYLEEGHY